MDNSIAIQQSVKLSIDANFYENLCLLMHVVPPSFRCKEQCRQGMFNKPNTVGFVHVSHYLLTVHNAERFRKMVKWPLFCKRSEATYRTEVKNYLTVLAQENPDINFPPIQISYFLHAAGIKLLVIMWKLSELALRAYIERENSIGALRAPKVGTTSDLIKTYYHYDNLYRQITLNKLQEEFTKASESLEDIVKELKHENDIKKTEILFRLQQLQKVLTIAPVNPLIVPRLQDLQDSDIINSWRHNLLECKEYVINYNSTLMEIKRVSSVIYSLLSSLLNMKILKFSRQPEISSKFNTPPRNAIKIQQFGHGLYVDGLPKFTNFLALINEALDRAWHRLKLNLLPDLSEYKLQLEKCFKEMLSTKTLFSVLLSRVSNAYDNTQDVASYRISNDRSCNNSLLVSSYRMLLSSPKVNFSLDCKNEMGLLDRIFVSPDIDRNSRKQLFSRHERKFMEMDKSPVPKLNNADVSWFGLEGPRSPFKVLSPVSPKYVRLFESGKIKRKRLREKHMASTPNNSKFRARSKRHHCSYSQNASDLDLCTAAESVFNLSCDIANTVAFMCKARDEEMQSFHSYKNSILPVIRVENVSSNSLDDSVGNVTLNSEV